MKIVKFNISKPKKYVVRDGQEKTQWNNIGTITEFHKDDGRISRIIEIPAIGLEANVFPFEPKNPNGTLKTQPVAQESVENSTQGAELDAGGEVNADELPF